MGTDDPGLGKITPPDETPLQPEEIAYLEGKNRGGYIKGIIESNGNDLKNVIADAIGAREEVFVVLEEQDVVGIRSIKVLVNIDRGDCENKNVTNLCPVTEKIMNALRYQGYSVSKRWLSTINLHNETTFRCSPEPIK